jgi:hypothetical protein
LQFKIAVPDLVSNSYFPAVAAVELGHFRNEGLDVSVEFISPIEKAYLALKNREVQFVPGSAHSALSCFQEWVDVKLVCALSQGNTDITNAAVDGLNRFAMNAGLAKNSKPYSELVAS